MCQKLARGGGGTKEHPSTKFTPKEWDNHPPDKEYFDELFRVSKNQIIWGANHFIERMPFNSPCWLVWDKQMSGGKFADCELAWTSFKGHARLFTFAWSGFRQGDMKNKEKRIHPTQKPVRLYEWILKTFTHEGDKILDTHVGSASSLIACYNFSLDYVGFEIDEEYYKAAKERMAAVQAQIRLW